MLFNIDEDAYERLSSYLGLLRANLDLGNDPEEVMKDIEMRMAELLQQRLTEHKKAITLSDVEFAISEMGEPEDIEDNDPGKEKDKKEDDDEKGARSLFRDTENRVISGVSSGMAAFFAIDPLWLRLAFVFLTLVGGSGILIYLIMWLIVPEARTASDRLQMRGERVTASNIANSLEKEFNQVKDNIKGWSKKKRNKNEKPNSNNTDRTLDFLTELLSRAWQFFLLVLGLIIVIFTIYLSVILILAVFTNIWPHLSFSPFSEITFSSFLFQLALNDFWAWLTLIGVLGFIMIPLIKGMINGVMLLFKLKKKNKITSRITFSLWVFSFLLLIASVSIHVIHYSKTEVDTCEKVIQSSEDVLFVEMNTNNDLMSLIVNGEQKGKFVFSQNESSLMIYKYPSIKFAKNTNDTLLRVVAIAERRGGAGDFVLDQNTFKLDSAVLNLSWRAYVSDDNSLINLTYQVYLPDSMIMHFSETVKEALHSRNYLKNTDMSFEYFVLDENKLRHTEKPK